MTSRTLPCIVQQLSVKMARGEATECCQRCAAEWAPCSVRSLQPRQHVFFAGDPQAYVYKVESGALRLYVTMPNGRRGVIDFCLAGDLVGLGTQDKHLFNAQALGATQLRCLPKVAFARHLLQNAQACFNLYEAATIQLNRAQFRTLVISGHDAEKSLAAFILRLSLRRQQQCDDPFVIPLPMSRSDIADHLGLTTETVCRTFTKFRRRGLIRLQRSRLLEIIDIDRLRELAQEAIGYDKQKRRRSNVGAQPQACRSRT